MHVRHAVRPHGLVSLLWQTLPYLLATCALGACIDTPSQGEPEGTISHAVAPLWSNGDFESNAIGAVPTGWTVQAQLNKGITSTLPAPQTYASLGLQSGGTAMTYVVGGATESQVDPALGATASLRYPKYGLRAAVVNYNPSVSGSGSNYNANVMRQTMTTVLGDVDASDGKVHVRFALAPVLENPGHGYTAQPYYYVELKNLTRGTTLYQDFNTSGQSGVPWRGSGTLYTDWQLVDIAPGNVALQVGDQVELIVVAAGCGQGGHWGRVYVDGIGSTIPGLYTWATGPQSANAGSDVTYVVSYRNGGTGIAAGSSLTFNTPPSTTFRAVSLGALACTSPAIGSTGAVTCSLGALATGATGTYTVTVRIDAGTATGTVLNAGDYSIAALGISPLLGPKVQTTVTTAATYADVSITKTDGVAGTTWGSALDYTIVVSNAGPSAAPSVAVADAIPASLTGSTWTCTGAAGGTCGAASGSGSLATSASLPVNGSVTYVLHANVVSGSGSGSVSNTASATVGGGVIDPDTSNNSAIDTDSISSLLRTITLTKSGAIGGSVTSTPAAIACGTLCSSATGQFVDGSTVILTASPVAGATFGGWGGACASAGTATTCSLTASANLSVTASFEPPPTITATAGTLQSANASSAFASALQVRVTDSLGNPIAGATVTFSAPTSGASATLSSATAVTNASGYASVSATANGTLGAYAVTATTNGALLPASFLLTNVVGTAAAISASGGTPQSTSVGTAFTTALSATVTDASGNPIAGKTVTFSAPSSGASATLSSATAVTNASGVASITATASTVAGAYSVSASTSGVAASATFALTNVAGAAASISVSGGGAQSTTVGSTFGSALAALVADAYGNPITGKTVTFTAPSSGASATLSGTTATTSASGIASITATAGALAGSYSVTASTSGVAASATFALTNVAGAAASVATSGGGTQAAVVGTAFASPLSVLVTDASGNPIAGKTVSFAAPSSGASASLSGASAITNASGIASVTASAGTVVGSYGVTASVSGVPSPATFALTNLPGLAASISVSGGGVQSAMVGIAFGSALSALVVDAYGNAVPGAAVAFTGPASGPGATLSSASATTNAFGVAAITASAGTVAGSYALTATTSGAPTPASFALTNVAGSAATITVNDGTPQSALVGTAFGSALSVLVTDAYGNPLSGQLVSFSQPSTGARAALSSATATTNGAGIAGISASAGTIAGSYTVTASASGAASPVSFALTNLTGAVASIAASSGGAQSTTVGTPFASPLSVTVLDAYGNPVAGQTVTFAAPSSGASAIVSSTTAITDASGIASVSATASTIAGSYAVSASVGSASPASFALTNLTGAAASLALSGGDAKSTTVGTPFASPLAVLVTDAYGNPVAGQTVTFAAPSSGASAIVSSTTAITDASGVASVTASAGTSAGAYSVGASVEGTSPLAFSLTNLPGGVASVTITGGQAQSTTVGTAFADALSLRVQDAYGNPLAGVTATFSAASSGASASLSSTSVVTDATGAASVGASANTVAGSHAVQASVAGYATPVSYPLTNLPGDVASITIDAGDAQQAVVATAFGSPLSVLVRDAFGNALAGRTIVFTVPGSGASAVISATSATTDASGIATIDATAGTIVGSYALVAADGSVSASFALANLPGAPAAIHVTGGDAQSAVVATGFASELTVEVVDAYGNAVPGVSVGFVAPTDGASASLGSTLVTTDAAGRASTQATAGTVVGSYVVQASVPGVAIPGSFALSNEPGGASELVATGGDGQDATVGSAFATALSLVVHDAYGNVVPGVTITLSVPASGASAELAATTLTSDAAGAASVSATAGHVSGAYVVQASIPGSTVAFALVNDPGAAASIELASGDGQSATVGAALGAPLVVRVRDAFGNLVPGATVSFDAPPSGPSAVLASASVTTDASGSASVDVTAGTIAGSYLVHASVAGVSLPATFSLVNVAAGASTIVASAGGGQSATVGTPFGAALVVLVTDAFGNPVAGATVTFEAPSSGASTSLGAPSAVTDASGHASVSASASALAGNYDVLASVPGASSPATFSLTNAIGAPFAITVDPASATQSSVVDVAFAQALGVVVTDLYGNLVPNVSITFTTPSSGASAALATMQLTTDANGHASVVATAGTTTGGYVVTAEIAGVPSATFSLTNLPGAPAHLIVVSGDPQTTLVATAFGAPLEVKVTDAFDNVVPEVTVGFAAPSGGATATLSASTAQTDASGLARVDATASSLAGSFTVTASVAGIAAPATFTLSAVAEGSSVLTLVHGDGQSAVVDTDYADALEVLVSDRFGNPIAGASVSFQVPASGASVELDPLTVITDANGRASARVTANTIAGTVGIVATTPSASASAEATLTNLAGPAVSIVPTLASTPQSTTAGTEFVHELEVLLVDAFGNPVPNASVSFSAPADAATATFSLATVTTDAEGKAHVLATASGAAGTYSVLATTPGVDEPATFALTNLVGTPTTLVVLHGDAQSAPGGQAFAAPVVLQVVDAHGNPVAGVTVTITLPASGASATTATLTLVTDASGQVSIDFTAGTAPGSYAIAFQVEGADAPALVSFTNEAIPTTTTLEVDLPRSHLGQHVTFRASVSSEHGVPTGSVRFLDGTEERAVIALDASGAAELVVEGVAIGALQLVAEYVPVDPFLPSSSAGATTTVRPGDVTGGATCSVGEVGRSGGTPLPLALLLAATMLVLARRRGSLPAVRALALPLVLGATSAQAQSTGINVDQLRATATPQDGFAVSRPTTLPHRAFAAQLVLDYAYNPLVYETNPGQASSERYSIIRHQLVGTAVAAYGLVDRVTIFAMLPMSLVMRGDAAPFAGLPVADGTHVGDPLVGARVRIAGDQDDRFALGGQLALSIPLAGLTDNGQRYAGDRTVVVVPSLLGEARWDRFRLDLNLGARLRGVSDVDLLRVGQELTYGAGATVHLVREVLDLHVELYGATTLGQNRTFGRANTPLEALAGVKYHADSCWTAGAAAGTGLLRGYGSPDFRAIASIAYQPRCHPAPVPAPEPFVEPEPTPEPIVAPAPEPTPEPVDPDRDDDGVLDEADACVDVAEDLDGIADADGCPETDADEDAIGDDVDHCPLTAGIENVTRTECNGCPARACITESGQIEILDRVEFATGRDVILARSFEILSEVGRILETNPQLTRVRVEGHTDDRGNPERNLELSRRRAASVVRWLGEHGIASERLESEGLGDTRPLAPNTTSRGRQTNRRVEFHVVTP